MGTTKLTARATNSEDPPDKRAGRILAGPSRSTPGKSDEALVKLAKLGDEGAIATLYERYSAAILRYCCSILRSQQEAEDIQQEVFLHAISALRHGPGPISFRPWLYRVAHNACISHLRSRKPTVVAEDDSLATASTEPETAQREELRQLLADISRLSPVQRAALLLREMDGLSYEQIATALDLPLTTVRSTIFRARATLQGMAEARDADCETIQAELSEMADRRGRRSRRITSHLRVCTQCREFREGLRYRPSGLGDCAPSRLNGLRNAKVAAIVAGLVALVGGGLRALGAIGSSGATPTTAERQQPKAPIAPAVPPRVVTVPAPPQASRRSSGGADRGSATHEGARLGPRPAAPAAPRARGEQTAPATDVDRPLRRSLGGGHSTLRPQGGGGAVPAPREADPQPGSGPAPAMPSTSSGPSDASGAGGSTPETSIPGTGTGAGGAAPGAAGSGGNDVDTTSTDRPVVTHNDSVPDAGAADAAAGPATQSTPGSGERAPNGAPTPTPGNADGATGPAGSSGTEVPSPLATNVETAAP